MIDFHCFSAARAFLNLNFVFIFMKVCENFFTGFCFKPFLFCGVSKISRGIKKQLSDGFQNMQALNMCICSWFYLQYM